MKRTRAIPIKPLMPLVFFVVIVAAAIISIASVQSISSDENLEIIENNIRHSVIVCYSQEGSYPPDIAYLEENYGLKISDEYNVVYDIFASNIMPQIKVIRG